MTRPGRFARVATALAERGVNITASSAWLRTPMARSCSRLRTGRHPRGVGALTLAFEEHDPTGGMEPEAMTVGDLRPGAAGRGSLG
jgi:hypothetical protein